MKFLIVGLGNPGNEYAHTRHNIGFDVVNAFITKHEGVFKTDRLAYTAEVKWKGKKFVCICPTTYMNLSGRAVKALSSFYKIDPESILVVHDELDLPVGEIRLKYDGGAGGHNGLIDIINHLNTKQFYRLRIGIGHPGNSKEASDYVLKPPKKSEREQINEAMQKALEVMPLLMDGYFQKAMHKLHS